MDLPYPGPRQEALRTSQGAWSCPATSLRAPHGLRCSANSRSWFLLNRGGSLHVAGQNLPIRDGSHPENRSQEIKEFSRLCRLEGNDDCGDIYGLGKICPTAAGQGLPSGHVSAAIKTGRQSAVVHAAIVREHKHSVADCEVLPESRASAVPIGRFSGTAGASP